ncbi:flavodoxin domain-containing protein [Marinibacterium profundimaris]|uniref:Protoporphyrinogen oxidase n=1 Tax=Marinibacterium profundimaris TaxID=1679460 RepID=A0A225NSX5_9RHOB|nr:flavodoxin domain-containing protein [Marinibacterium profundimaris]OWU77945.1 protoporphyrinogen oxidase [Marinibacterium profundimaris]
MRILITYATTEGQTRKIARFCADQLISRGHSVELLRVEDAGDIELAVFDTVLLAGSVHIGKLQEPLARFAETHAQALNGMPTMLIVVSLAIAGDDPNDREELDRIAAAFAAEAGWTPGQVEHVAGAFKFSEYDFFRTLAMRWIAWQKGEEIKAHEDREYTDWAGLAAVITKWQAAAAPLPERAKTAG